MSSHVEKCPVKPLDGADRQAASAGPVDVRVQSIGASDLLIGLLSSTRSIEGALIQPTVGALSDRVSTRFGRRRPFLVVGIPLSAVFFVAGAFVNSLLSLALVIFLFSIFFNVAV